MKYFTIQKIGYTAGIYGCSGEYFSLIITDGATKDKYIRQYFFSGMYGPEERIAGILKQAGYEDKHIQSIYGKLTRKDIPSKLVFSEYELAHILKAEYLPILSTYDGMNI
jgi:hypothetical protein